MRFQDRWQGRLLAVEVDGQWEVLNVVVSRGLFHAVSVRLPFTIAREWSDEQVVLDCTSEEAFAREIPPLAAPATALSARTPVSVPELRLTGLVIDKLARRVSQLLLAAGRFLASERSATTEQVSLRGNSLSLAVQPDVLAPYRSDEELRRGLQRALAAHPHLTGEDHRGLSVDVIDGAVYLSGNVRSPQGKLWAEEAAFSVAAGEVWNDVVDDLQLEIDLGQALNRAGLFRRAEVYVRSALGEVTLSGSAAPGAVDDIERIAAGVPGVRSLTNRMEVRSAPPPPPPAPRPAEAPPGEEPTEPVAPG